MDRKVEGAVGAAIQAFRAAASAGRALNEGKPAGVMVREANLAGEKLAAAHKSIDMLTDSPVLKKYRRALELLDRAHPYRESATYGEAEALALLESLLSQLE